MIVGGGRGAGGELRGQGVRRAHRHGRSPGAAAVSAGDRGVAPHVGLQRSEQGGVRGVRQHHARWSKGCRSTRPFSTWAACGESRARPVEIAARLRREVLERVGLPHHRRRGAHEVPRQGRERGGQARRAAGGAARRGARVPPPVAGRATVGCRADHRRASSTTGASRAWARSPALPEAVLVAMLGRASGRQLHALAHNRDPRPVVVGRRRGSIGSQRALGFRPTLTRRRRLVGRRAGRSRHPPHAGRRPGRPHRRASSALRRPLPGHALAHLAGGDGAHPDRPDTVRVLLAAGRTP